MVRVNYIPKNEHFINDWQGSGFPVFKSQRFPLRGRGFGGGAISHFFSNTILPYKNKNYQNYVLHKGGINNVRL